VLLPRGATVAKQPLCLGLKKALSSWRVDIAAPTGQNATQFLNVLEVTDSSHLIPVPVLPLSTGRESLVGVQVGDQVAVFDSSPSPTALLTYDLSSTPAIEQYVLNQAPGKWYRLVVQNAAGAPLQEQRAEASDQGVLVFSITSTGARKVVIRPVEQPRHPWRAEAKR
jgi:hypothetical protein